VFLKWARSVPQEGQTPQNEASGGDAAQLMCQWIPRMP
jgi:hypothetical protein